MTNDKNQDWDNATWEGSRKAQLKQSLKLSPKERFEALETLAETSNWLVNAPRTYHEEGLPVKEPQGNYSQTEGKK
ncbi:MAG: hypothetical protein ABFS24_05870 [Pseudomonadota bacterium]